MNARVAKKITFNTGRVSHYTSQQRDEAWYTFMTRQSRYRNSKFREALTAMKRARDLMRGKASQFACAT